MDIAALIVMAVAGGITGSLVARYDFNELEPWLFMAILALSYAGGIMAALA